MSNVYITRNTGRGYSEEGQIITIFVDSTNSVIYFYDRTRMVEGIIEYRPPADPWYYMLASYDSCNYRYPNNEVEHTLLRSLRR